MNKRIPFRVKPMLATLADGPFQRRGWIYEEKYDGIRILAYKEANRIRLLSRNGIERTDSFPLVASAMAVLPFQTLLLDGEVVTFDQDRVSRFQLLQQDRVDAKFVVFDCLFREGVDLRGEPLSARRLVMEQAIARSRPLMPSRRLATDGIEAFRIAKRRGYEGIVAKDLASSYSPGRSASWLKVKVHQQDEFVIAGYTRPAGSRKYFGALLLGAYAGRELRYVGKVGTGFSQKTLATLHGRFRALIRSRSSLAESLRERGAVFLAPRLIAQIAYQEWTADAKLRQPVFLGLRDDKSATEVLLPTRIAARVAGVR
jgi:bifunctional non-homologous end joining protein LigD